MNKLTQKGFTVVEGLLIIIAAILLVGVGTYVARSDDKETKSDTKPSSLKSKPQADQKDYLVVKELGIKFDKSALPTAYYKINPAESKRAYPQVPELTYIQFYDSSFDNLKNSKGEACKSRGSEIATVEVMLLADRDKKYSNYKEAFIGPNDDVPTVVSDKYATQKDGYLYDYFKSQGVQAPISCVNPDDAEGNPIDNQIQEDFLDSYSKLKDVISTFQQV